LGSTGTIGSTSKIRESGAAIDPHEPGQNPISLTGFDVKPPLQIATANGVSRRASGHLRPAPKTSLKQRGTRDDVTRGAIEPLCRILAWSAKRPPAAYLCATHFSHSAYERRLVHYFEKE
jgi:hypothetical protein